MGEKEINEIRDVVAKTVADTIDEKMKDFYIEREKHYQHHKFIDGLMKWTDRISNTAMQTVVKTIVSGLIWLMIIGFIVWIYIKQLKGA